MKVINDFKDYEILDMANGQKLEKWGNIILSRPDPQIIWTDKNIDKWNEYAEYNRSSTGGGKWNIKKNIPDSWIIEYKDLKFNLDRNGLEYQTKELEKSPIIVGFGPSGMFAGLALAKMGLKPIIIEQGKCVDERKIDVENFWQQGKLNKFSNVQFGEGGAGTFSDGKLNSNTSNEITKKVINELYLHGAPKEILIFQSRILAAITYKM